MRPRSCSDPMCFPRGVILQHNALVMICIVCCGHEKSANALVDSTVQLSFLQQCLVTIPFFTDGFSFKSDVLSCVTHELVNSNDRLSSAQLCLFRRVD